LSFITSAPFPTSDSAFFEYFGRSLNRGARLYTDLWDTKLPSIYLLNGLWWRLFGDDYRAHLIVETIINGIAIALFAWVLRRFEVKPWLTATLAFSLLYLFVGGPQNQTERYATPLILLGVLLSTYGRYVACGIVLVIASTFWVPSLPVAAVPILVCAPARGRLAFLGAALGAACILALTFVHFWGRANALELLQSWVSYETGNYQHTNYQPVRHQYPVAFLSPGFYIYSGFGCLLFVLATFWQKGKTPSERFALIWSASTLLVVALIGRNATHYFLPLYGPLVMLIALQEVNRRTVLRRWPFAAIAAAFAVSTVLVVVQGALTKDRLVDAITYSGDKVRETYGVGAVAMLPWEAYLTSYAVPPSPFFLERDAKFAADRDVWTRTPVVYVDDATEHFNRMAPPAGLHIICHDARLKSLMIITRDPIKNMSCSSRQGREHPSPDGA
jgi:hypothetical protein